MSSVCLDDPDNNVNINVLSTAIMREATGNVWPDVLKKKKKKMRKPTK